MAKKETVTVKVTSGQPLCEDGVHYVKGDTFETTAERAAGLAAFVEVVTDAAKKEATPPA